MAIPSVDRSKVLDALKTFDDELRGTDAWSGWEKNRNYKFAIVYRRRKYPVKQIISMATGAPRNSFSGGEESIRFLKRCDIDVAPLD